MTIDGRTDGSGDRDASDDRASDDLAADRRAGDGIAIAEEDPIVPDVAALLRFHLERMRASSPPGSVHALDLDALRVPSVRFWTARDAADGTLLGCGALSRLDDSHGELKSMRTAPAALRRGVARALLERIVAEARAAGLGRLSLETGSGPAFEPALALYERAGFVRTGPFAGYVDDPFSVFMTLSLEHGSGPGPAGR